MRGQVEARVGPERHGDVEIAGRPLDQQVDQPDRAARQAIDLVEHQQARRPVLLDRPRQHPHLLHRGRGSPGLVRAEKIGIQPGVLERGGEVAAEQVGRVVAVQRDPADDHPLFPHAAGDVGQHGGLPEAGGCLQYGEPALQQPVESRQQRGAAHVPGRRFGGQHLGFQQPG